MKFLNNNHFDAENADIADEVVSEGDVRLNSISAISLNKTNPLLKGKESF